MNIYLIYRKLTGQYLGTVMNCISETQALRLAQHAYGSGIYACVK